ncbi:negative transcriptional regulator, PaiB family [Seinonella peptonophila]|uniref:Negative transcriptional regulator, PaiB family n=1 Tax=Seinonella peptonophila TaxID=112248 RepID=A0A1M4SJX3_9BACL|nr:FMN-binding negative transcriptional regulator [Seinonella peptonophila]SHE32501.1 negative transcriptional regulator, PaiB family [Seinonella peptonophila]
MYIPPQFRIEDDNTIYEVINKYSFATLISQHHEKPWATHLPLILDQSQKYLYGHFARPNPQWKEIESQAVLAIFHGPHCFISPSWYETNKAVPTWNYISVHVYGQVKIIEGNELMESLKDMVLKYEEPNSSYQLDQVEASYIDGMSKGIVGFKIKIDRLEGKAKLSQNHPKERQKLIIRQLEQSKQSDDQQIATLMKGNLQKDSS